LGSPPAPTAAATADSLFSTNSLLTGYCPKGPASPDSASSGNYPKTSVGSRSETGISSSYIFPTQISVEG